MPLKNLFNTLPHPFKQCVFFFVGLWGMTGILSSVIYSLVAADISTPEKLDDLSRQLFFVSFALSLFMALLISVTIYHWNNQKKWFKEYKNHKKKSHKKQLTNGKEKNNITTKNQLLHILAVDDNSANLLILHNYLARSPIVFLSAENGSQALRILQSHSVDIILMDVEMQGMDGISATKIIRSLELENSSNHSSTSKKRVPIIGISAHNEKGRRIEMLAAGFDDYITKPISQKTLFTSLQRWHDIENPVAENNEGVTTNEQEIIYPCFDEKPEKIRKVIDIQQSLENSNNNPTLASDMLTLLITMLHEEKTSLISLQNKQDWEALYQLNHKIYGGCSYCGTPELQKASQQLESALHNFLLSGQVLHESHEHLSNQLSAETIAPLFSQLIKAIDDIIEWDTQYDIKVVLGIDD